MLILTIDTTGNSGYVALFKGEEVLISEKLERESQTSEILKKIDLILKKKGKTLREVDFFAACTGPGSFTGTRIGVINAKTFGYALNKPVLGFSSFVGREPSVVFIGKKRVARKGFADEEITFGQATEEELFSPATLDMQKVANHLNERALNSKGEREKVEITYPEVLGIH